MPGSWYSPGSSRWLKAGALPHVLFMLALLVAPIAYGQTPVPAAGDSISDRVSRVLATSPLVDGHNDLLIHFLSEDSLRSVESYPLHLLAPGQTDIPRWRQGQVSGSFITISGHFTDHDAGLRQMLRLLAELISKYPEQLTHASAAADLDLARADGRVALIPHLEDGGQLDGSLERLRSLYAAGLRSVGLTWDHSSDLADAARDTSRWNGLSPTGRSMVAEMNRLGIIVDLSHASDSASLEVLALSSAPVVFSHSSARAVADVPRNVPDRVLRRVAETGGVVMVTFVPYFTTGEYAEWFERGEAVWDSLLVAHSRDRAAATAAMTEWESANPPPSVTLSDVVRHIEHVRRVAGVDHVGLGSDFDGMFSRVAGLEDVSAFPLLLETLARRGWTDQELRKLAGENLLRVWKAVEAAATGPRPD